MKRIYYNNEEGDGPRVITHGGEDIVWQPKGEVWERRWTKTKYFDQHRKEWFERNERQWFKTDQPGAPISYHLLTNSQMNIAFQQKNNRDGKLVTEEKIRDLLDVKTIDQQISELHALKASKENEENVKRGPGRPRKDEQKAT